MKTSDFYYDLPEELIAQTRSVKVLVTAEAEESAADSAEDEGETGEEKGDGSDDEGDGEEIYILTVLKTAADRVFTGFTELVTQFSVTEFLLFSLCITVNLSRVHPAPLRIFAEQSAFATVYCANIHMSIILDFYV